MATHKPVHVDELFGELIQTGSEAKWNVIHTKPQCEKKLADYLRSMNIGYYLPLFDSEKVYEHRKVLFTKPLFPGYVFSAFELKDKLGILNCGYVVRFIKVPNQLELLDDLNWIYRGRQNRIALEQNNWLEKGWQVKIVSGPMQGMLGVVESQARLNEVILQVKMLHQSVKVKVNPADVQVLSEYYYEPN